MRNNTEKEKIHFPINVPINVPVSRREKLKEIIASNPSITAYELAAIFSVTTKTIKRDLIMLKETGQVRRVGSDKSGYWEVVK